MSTFQTQFDEAASEASRLVVNHGSAIRELLPKFHGRDFDRLIKSISKLLEHVDKGNTDHPEYLAHARGNIATYAVQLIAGIPASLESGSSHFVQNTLSGLLICEERLFKAVGNYFYQVREVKDRQVKEIQKLAEEAFEFREGAAGAKKDINKTEEEARNLLNNLRDLDVTARTTLKQIEDARDAIIKLASGDGRGKSLEALKRLAEEKVQAIQSVLIAAEKASNAASASVKQLETASATFKATQSDIDSLKTEASEVLSLSSQAGLASSYLKESKKLANRSMLFTAILYVTSVAAAVIAGWYVLPTLEHTVSSGKIDLERALPLTLLRATVLAPLVYVIYFTTRQISSFETLRMDYAEKAAASLAYSGYKEEMSEDTSLLERLRGSLLLKFAEHPERLLRKRPVTDRIEVEAPGFRASSSSAEAHVYRDTARDTEE